MQIIKVEVECQECEAVSTFETKAVGLIMRTLEDKTEFVGHNLDLAEALLNGIGCLADGDAPREEALRFLTDLPELLDKLKIKIKGDKA